MKFLLILIAAAVVAKAQPTIITGTLVGPGGDRLSGTCTFTASTSFTAGDGTQVTPTVPTKVPFSGGSLRVALEPNDTGVPAGTSYLVNCTAPNQSATGSDGKSHASQGSWGPWTFVVPTSSSPVTLQSVLTATPPNPSAIIQPTQINAQSLSDGRYCLVVVGHLVTGMGPCITNFSWASLTSGQWAGLTSTQWSTLTP